MENAAVYAFTDNPFWFMLEDTQQAIRALSIDLASGVTTRHLIVSAGIGYSGLPLRIGQPPEITLVHINGGAV